MFNLRQCWWPEVSTWPFTCSQSSHLWASLLCVFFPTSSSEQSLAVPLLLQLLPSLSSMPRKKPCLGASVLLSSLWLPHKTAHPLIYPAVSFRRNWRVGNTQGYIMEKGRYISNRSCSTGTMLICFLQCQGFFGECDLLWNYAALHFGEVEGLDFRSHTLLQEFTRWFYTYLELDVLLSIRIYFQ